MSDETISLRDAVEAYLSATGSSPSLAEQLVAEVREPGTLRLELLGDPLPYFVKDGRVVVERARFDELMAHLRDRRYEAKAP
jgi:hypothetical protein